MRFFGDEWLELQDLLGSLPHDILWTLQGHPYNIQPLSNKELAFMGGSPAKAIRYLIRDFAVNKFLNKHPKEFAKYKKILETRDWTFPENNENRGSHFQ